MQELHELVLNKHQSLIIAKIAKEAAEENANILRSDITLLNVKLQEEQQQYSREIDLLRYGDALNISQKILKYLFELKFAYQCGT